MINRPYAVFLDIDGVFCSTRVYLGHTCTNHQIWDKFDAVAIDFMNTIDATYSVDFVLMSTWKNHLSLDNVMIFHWINSAFRNAGFRGEFPYKAWKTNPQNKYVDTLYNRTDGRAHEVKDYLAEFGPYKDFILFDDTNYGFNEVLGVKRFVHTSPEDGILTKHMRNAKAIMGSWDKK